MKKVSKNLSPKSRVKIWVKANPNAGYVECMNAHPKLSITRYMFNTIKEEIVEDRQKNATNTTTEQFKADLTIPEDGLLLKLRNRHGLVAILDLNNEGVVFIPPNAKLRPTRLTFEKIEQLSKMFG